MRRRQFLWATATTGSIGLLAGCGGNETTTRDAERAGPGTPTPTATTDGTKPDGDSGTETTRSADGGWTSGGVMDGVSFAFSSGPPECGQQRDETDIEFDAEAGEVVVTGTISGSDLCKRAHLADLDHDPEAGSLSVAISTVDRQACAEGTVAAGQCIVEIEYDVTLAVDGELPRTVSVSHDGRGVASAAHGSASAVAPSETAEE